MDNRKLNIIKIRNFAIWTAILFGIGMSYIFAIKTKSKAKVEQITIQYGGAAKGDQLISKKEILNILTKKAKKPLNSSAISTLDLRAMEAELNKDERIEKADIYIDANNHFNVRIVQKNPIMRVLTNGQDYYIDSEGEQIMVKPGSIAHVPVVNGVDEAYSKQVFKDATKTSSLKNIFKVLKATKEDEFANALIEQATISKDSLEDIILIPKIGRESIVFGDATNISEKIQNLKIFYKDGLPKLGWNRYKKLNLKQGNQVVGTLLNPDMAKVSTPVIKRDSLTAEVLENRKQSSIHH